MLHGVSGLFEIQCFVCVCVVCVLCWSHQVCVAVVPDVWLHTAGLRRSHVHVFMEARLMSHTHVLQILGSGGTHPPAGHLSRAAVWGEHPSTTSQVSGTFTLTHPFTKLSGDFKHLELINQMISCSDHMPRVSMWTRIRTERSHQWNKLHLLPGSSHAVMCLLRVQVVRSIRDLTVRWPLHDKSTLIKPSAQNIEL